MKVLLKAPMNSCWKTVVTVLVLLGIFAVPALGADTFNLRVDGQMIDTGTEGTIVRNGTTFLPLRTTATALRCEVSWTGDFANIVKEDREIQIFPGNHAARLQIMDQQSFVRISEPAFIQNGKTYVPLRFIAQALNMSLWWDPKTSTADIYTETPYSGTLEERSVEYFMLEPLMQKIMDSAEGYKIGGDGKSLYFSQNAENIEIRVDPVRKNMFCITVLPHEESKVTDTALENTLQVFLGNNGGRNAFNLRKSLSFGARVERWFGGKRVYIIKDASEYITISD